jgi:allantoate deiminase
MVTGGEQAVARCDALGIAPYSDAEGMLFRAYLTPAHAAALEELAEWMREAGMTVHTDGAANLIGRYEGWQEMPPLIIGSHIDSVRDGGCYDGPLGIMLGIEAVAALSESGKRLPFPIEIYVFGDEEGSRFPASMLTSRVVAGMLDEAALDIADRDGIGLAEALAGFAHPSTGVAWQAPPGSYLSAAHGPALAYFEAHIEQGPVLEAEGLAVGVVTGIAAQLRYQLTVTGVAGHAGTTTMKLRTDALTAAAEMVLATERIAREADSDVVATVGRLIAAPGAPNVIPGRVEFTLDIRSIDAGRRDAAAAAILAEFEAIAARRGVSLASAQVNDFAASPCDPKLMDLLSASLAANGQREFRLPSGAGHDAMNMAALCPTAMLFIRCRGGVSHNPAEHVEPADAEIALQAMLGFIERLGETV